MQCDYIVRNANNEYTVRAPYNETEGFNFPNYLNKIRCSEASYNELFPFLEKEQIFFLHSSKIS